MSRKRKEQPQSSTLFSFFGRKNPCGPVRNKRRTEKLDDERRAKLTRTALAPALDGGCGGWKTQETDVIVIESDDEVETQLVDCSSDVEIITVEEPCKYNHHHKVSHDQSRKLETDNETVECPARKTTQQCISGLDRFELDDVLDNAKEKDESDDWALAMCDDELDVAYNGFSGGSYDDSIEGLESLEVTEVSTEPGSMNGTTSFAPDFTEIQTHISMCVNVPATSDRTSFFSADRELLKPLTSFNEASSSKICSSNLDSKMKSTSAFAVLMSGKAQRERAAWAEAQTVEDRNFRPTKADRRKAPFYKVLTGMPIAVDAFRYGSIPGVKAYFLTHAHSDHYTNLSSKWKNGLIYCSETTANLIVHMLSVDRKWIRSLPMDTPVEVPDTGGVKVTLIDANHCPGSCLFLFVGSQSINAGDSTFKSSFVGTARTFRYLHCGDFRASPQHVLHPAVKGKHLDAVYLDTTYLNPRYCFPPQPLVVRACAELARRIVNGESLDDSQNKHGSGGNLSIRGWMKVGEGKGKQKSHQPGDVLIVVGTYSIGKERVVKVIAQALNSKVYCDSRKTAILHCQNDPELHAILTNKPLEAGVHVVPLGVVASDRFKEYMERWNGHWSRAVAFRPTGWTYSPPAGADPMPPVSRVVASAQARDFTFAHLRPARNSTQQLMQYGVPYSEHSSFAELACFALSIDCARVIATVNVGNATTRAKMQKWVERWDAERKRRQEVGLPAVVEYRHLEYW